MLYTISNPFLTVQVARHGAELQSILGADGTEYLWQGDSRYWSDRALNIFPYVARLTKGQYLLDGKTYGMQIHGMAPYLDFSLVTQTQDSLVLELASNAQTLAQYPRQFSFQVAYALRGSTLEVTFRVENRDEKPMYFAVGGHPGFNVPLTPNGKFENYRLRFSSAHTPQRVGFTPDCFLNGQDTPFLLQEGSILPLHHDLFDEDAIVLRDVARQVTLEGEGRSITISYPDMPYLGIWHWPKTDAPYVCIEPWSSLPSTKDKIAVFEEQQDLLHLPAGSVYTNRWTVSFA